MITLKEHVEQAKNKYLEAKALQDEILDKLNNESSYDLQGDENIFRRAMILLVGNYINSYSSLTWNHDGIRLSKDTDCQHQKDYLGRYSIYTGYRDSGYRNPTYYGDYSGKICRKGDAFKAFESLHESLWKFHITENKYTGSLKNFTNACRNRKINFLKILQDYHEKIDDYDSVFEIINEPTLGVKNILICYKIKQRNYGRNI